MRNDDTAGRFQTLSVADIPVAFALLTRLPLPHLPDHAFDNQARAGWAFPFVGLAVAILAGLVGWVALGAGLTPALAAGLVLTAQIVVTGALHEDGLADTVDGLWGGSNPARRLEIMKDSAIGAYGVIALILSLAVRWIALTSLIPIGFAPIVAAAAFSRAVLPPLMMALPHARNSGLAHSVGKPGPGICAISVASGLALATLAIGPVALVACLFAGLAIAGVAALAYIKIGGQTGDILGAAQQMGEIAMLVAFTVLLTA